MDYIWCWHQHQRYIHTTAYTSSRDFSTTVALLFTFLPLLFPKKVYVLICSSIAILCSYNQRARPLWNRTDVEQVASNATAPALVDQWAWAHFNTKKIRWEEEKTARPSPIMSPTRKEFAKRSWWTRLLAKQKREDPIKKTGGSQVPSTNRRGRRTSSSTAMAKQGAKKMKDENRKRLDLLLRIILISNVSTHLQPPLPSPPLNRAGQIRWIT